MCYVKTKSVDKEVFDNVLIVLSNDLVSVTSCVYYIMVSILGH